MRALVKRSRRRRAAPRFRPRPVRAVRPALPPKRKAKRQVIRPAKALWWVLLVLCLALLGAEGWATSLVSLPWWLWTPLMLGTALVSLIPLFFIQRDSIYLTLDETGFVAKGIFALFAYRWADITVFGVKGKLVGLKFAQPTDRNGAADPFQRDIRPFDGIMPSRYGMEPAALAALLERWRRRAAE